MNEAEKREKLKNLVGDTVSRTLFVCISTPVDAENRWPPPVDVVTEHVEYMKAAGAKGQVFTSGPFLNEAGERLPDGLAIFDVPDREAAEELVVSDPFVRDGYRTVEIRAWQLNEAKKS